MTPAEYADRIVLPTVLRFREAPRDQCSAYLACLVASHMTDYLAAAEKAATGSPKQKDSVKSTMKAAANPAFDIVLAVCDATKHTSSGRENPVKFKAGQDMDRPPGRGGQMRAGISRAGDLIGGRVVHHEGMHHDLYDTVVILLRVFQLQYPQYLGEVDLSVLQKQRHCREAPPGAPETE